MKRLELDVPDSVYETLRAMAHPNGSTVTAIATGAIVQRAREFGRPIARQVFELHAQQLTTSEIAQALGLTNHQVSAELHKLALSANPRPKAEKPRSPRARTRKEAR